MVAASAVTMTTVAAAVVSGRLLNSDPKDFEFVMLPAAMAIALIPVGTLVVLSTPGNAVGRLLLGSGGIAAVEAFLMSLPELAPTNWLCQWLWWPPLAMLFLALLLFPDGRLPSPRWRPLAALLMASAIMVGLTIAVAAVDVPDFLTAYRKDDLDAWAATSFGMTRYALLVFFACLIGIIWALGTRVRTTTGNAQKIVRSLFFAGVLCLAAVASAAAGLPQTWIPLALAVPAAIIFAALRYQLYDLHLIINRTLVWLVMSAFLFAGFVVIVSLLGQTSHEYGLLSYGLIAITFEPLRHQVQRGVDQLLYGDRGNPYKIIQCLSELFGRTRDPSALLPQLVALVAGSLRLPYVGVEVDSLEGPRTLAEYGQAPAEPESFDLLSHGVRIGRLLAAPRTRKSHLNRTEQQILHDVAIHAAVAAETAQLIRDLQVSRERVVAVSEEERRRLRRDLHDGVGPALAGMAMQLRAATKVLAQPKKADAILTGLSEDLRLCTAEIRQLVDQLGPAALNHGLVEALRSECQRFTQAGLTVDLAADARIDGLPAVVETAAYRIASEALTNIAKHSKATRCQVTLSHTTTTLTMEIADNGVGIPSSRRRGVGLHSMRERAAELGGACVITEGEPTGTVVRVQLPVAPRLADQPPSDRATGSRRSGGDDGPCRPAGPPLLVAG
ncbi:MAG: sensor histidine kinase [Micromonosporaceae bacterium]|nr:sensor histidine kinase [Micromonosporaceae bacterium]